MEIREDLTLIEKIGEQYRQKASTLIHPPDTGPRKKKEVVYNGPKGVSIPISEFIAGAMAEENVRELIEEQGLPYEGIFQEPFLEPFQKAMSLYAFKDPKRNKVFGRKRKKVDLRKENQYYAVLTGAAVILNAVVISCVTSLFGFPAPYALGILYMLFVVFAHAVQTIARTHGDTVLAGYAQRCHQYLCVWSSRIVKNHERRMRDQTLIKHIVWGSEKGDASLHAMTDEQREANEVVELKIELPPRPAEIDSIVDAYAEKGYPIYVLAAHEAFGINVSQWLQDNDPIFYTIVKDKKTNRNVVVLMCHYGTVENEEELLAVMEKEIHLFYKPYHLFMSVPN